MPANSPTALIGTHWNNFTKTDKRDIRHYVLDYLARKGLQLEDYVTTSLIQLVVRITKLGWFELEQHREIVSETTKFLTAVRR